MLNIPSRALYDKRIPKNKFYEKIGANSKLKNKFKEEIDKVLWKYKLSKDTINLDPTKEVEEIQIFEVRLKVRDISMEILKNIDRVIPYPILYILKYKNDVKFAIAYKERNKTDENKMVVHSYYQSEWKNEDDVKLNILEGLNLKYVYENILKQLIPSKSSSDDNDDNIEDLIELNEIQKKLKKEILKLEGKIKREKQFNKKVELNIKLQKKKKELAKLMEN